MLLAGCVALGLAGCMPLTVDEAYREALPEEADLAIKVGRADTASGALASALLDPHATCPDCCVAGEGDAAAYVTGDLYKATRGAIRNVNGGLATVFAWIRTIVAFPYTSRSGDAYTWGPWQETDVDPLSRLAFRFTMEKPSKDLYAFRLEARNVNGASDPWEALASGTVTPGDAPHRGSGTLDLDFDRLHAMDAAHPSRLYGTVHYAFDVSRPSPTEATPNTVTVTFAKFYEKPAFGPDPAPMDATYRYWRYEDLAGRLEYTATADIAGPDRTPDGLMESLSAEARWNASGRGRASARVESQSVPGFTAYRSEECWADQAGLFYETWREDTATKTGGTEWSNPVCGAEAACPTF